MWASSARLAWLGDDDGWLSANKPVVKDEYRCGRGGCIVGVLVKGSSLLLIAPFVPSPFRGEFAREVAMVNVRVDHAPLGLNILGAFEIYRIFHRQVEMPASSLGADVYLPMSLDVFDQPATLGSG